MDRRTDKAFYKVVTLLPKKIVREKNNKHESETERKKAGNGESRCNGAVCRRFAKTAQFLLISFHLSFLLYNHKKKFY